MSLVHQHLPALGDKVIMVAPKGPHVALPAAVPKKREFRKSPPTYIPDFNKMLPTPAPQKVNEIASPQNAYHNGLPSSETDKYTTKESIVNNWFYPAIDNQIKAKLF